MLKGKKLDKLNKLDKSYENCDDLRDQSILNDKKNVIDDETTLPAIEFTEASFLENSWDEIDINSNCEKNNKVVNTKKHIYFLMLNKQNFVLRLI